MRTLPVFFGMLELLLTADVTTVAEAAFQDRVWRPRLAPLLPLARDQLLHISTDVMTTILKRAADRGEARPDVPPRVATLPTDLFRHELIRHRTPPSGRVLDEILDEVFLPLVRP